MAVLMADGFDFHNSAGDLTVQQGSGNLVWDSQSVGNFLQVGAAHTRFGVGQALIPNGSGGGSGVQQLQKITGSNDATVFFVCAFYYSGVALGVSGKGVGWVLYDSTTAQCGIWFEDDGAIRLRAGGLITGTVLAAYTGAYAASTWNQFQIEVTINSTTGAIHIRANGATSDSFSATGLNTQASANAYTNQLWQVTGGAEADVYFDDLLYFNTTGNAPTTWVGDVRAVQLMAASDPATDTFAASPSPPAQFGRTTNTGSSSYSASEMVCFSFTNSLPFSIKTINVEMNTALTGTMACAIYADNGSSKPGNIIAQSNQIVNPGVGINTFTLTGQVLCQANTNYYLAFWASAAYVTKGTGAVTTGFHSILTYTGTFPTLFPSTTADGNTPAACVYSNFGNFAAIYELIENGDTNYVYNAVPSTEDLYGNQSLLTTPVSIVGIVAKMMCRKDNSGARSGAIQFKSGVTEVNGTSTVLTTNYGWLTTGFESTDPNTSVAWTQTGVSNATLGPRVTA